MIEPFALQKVTRWNGAMLILFCVVSNFGLLYLWHHWVWPQMKLELERNGTTGAVNFSIPTLFEFVGYFAISSLLTFVTVGLFHLAGYRWDRKSPGRNLDSDAKSIGSFSDAE